MIAEQTAAPKPKIPASGCRPHYSAAGFGAAVSGGRDTVIGAVSGRRSELAPPMLRTHQGICNSAPVTSNDAAPRDRLHIAITPPST
jgi:hypothetical protein